VDDLTVMAAAVPKYHIVAARCTAAAWHFKSATEQ
jgi:hypothetical protein